MTEWRYTGKHLVAAIFVVGSLLAPAVAAPAGSLDPTFAGDGVETYGGSEARAVATAPKRIYFAAGQEVHALQRDGDRAVAFGEQSRASLGIDAKTTFITGIVAQSDRKILVTGFRSTTEDPRFLVARLTARGNLDPRFSRDGKMIKAWFGGGAAQAIVVQPDGKVLIAGTNVRDGRTYGIVVARLTPSGRTDKTFGGGDGLILKKGGRMATALAVQSDGRILIGGIHGRPDESATDFYIMRLRRHGRVDKTFGNEGEIRTDVGGSNEEVTALAIMRNGKIVAGGPGGAGFVAARYLADGSPDPRFGSNGTNTFSAGPQTYARDLILQCDGKPVLGGYRRTTDEVRDFILARLKLNGDLDPTFGNGGIVRTDISDYDELAALTGQGNGKLLAVGNTASASTDYISVPAAVVARYLTAADCA